MYFHLINLKSLISLSNFRMHQTQLCFSFLDAGTRFRLNDFLSRFHRYNRLEYLIFQVLSIPFQEILILLQVFIISIMELYEIHWRNLFFDKARNLSWLHHQLTNREGPVLIKLH